MESTNTTMYSIANKSHGDRPTDRSKRSKQANELSVQPPISQSLAQIERKQNGSVRE